MPQGVRKMPIFFPIRPILLSQSCLLNFAF